VCVGGAVSLDGGQRLVSCPLERMLSQWETLISIVNGEFTDPISLPLFFSVFCAAY
jgi:hypothetical protein